MAALNITKSNFQEEVLNSDKKVLIDFWASWCGPCRMVGPVIEQLAEEYAGRANVGKVNVDEEPQLASQFGIMSIPTLLVFKDGKLAKQMVGARPKADIVAMME